MNPLLKEIRHSPVLWMLVFVPAVLVAESMAPTAHTALFILAILAIVPLAALLSLATESVAEKTGDAIARRLRIPVRDVSYIQYGSSSRFALQSRGGDTIIQIWSKTAKSKPTRALKPLPILGKGKLDGKIYIFIRETTTRQAAMGLGKFKAMLKAIRDP